MLPSRGYFHDIQCPDLVCGRPYCHFGHRSRRKPVENVEETSIPNNSKPGIPTYKPTPKSELEQRGHHIPISYVPDLAFRPERSSRPPPRFENRPVYKPTPINLLSSIHSSPSEHDDEQKEQISEIKQDIANHEYDPSKSEINFEDLTNEFDQIDDILNESVKSEDILSENLSKLNDDIRKEQDRLNLLLNSEDLPEEIKHNIDETNSKCDEKVNETTNKESDKKCEQRSSSKGDKTSGEKSDSKHKDKHNKDSECSRKTSKNSSEISSKGKERDKEKSSKSKHSSSDLKHKEKSSSKEADTSRATDKSSKEKTERSKPNDKEREKHCKEGKKDVERDKHSSKERSSKEKTGRSKSDDKEGEKLNKEEKRDSSTSKLKEEVKVSKDKSKNEHKSQNHERKSRKESVSSDTSSESERLREKKKSKPKDSSNHSSDKKSRKDSVSSEAISESEKHRDKKNQNRKKKSDSSGSKHKLKKKKRSRSRSGSRSQKEEKSCKDKKLDKDRDRKIRKRKSDSSDTDHHSESSPRRKKIKKENIKIDKGRSRHKSNKSSREKHRKSSESSNGHASEFPVENDIVLSDIDIDFEDEDETMRECYRIFNEYAPSSVGTSSENPEQIVEGKAERSEDIFSSLARKRVAHPNAETSKPYSAPKPPTCKTVAPTPGQILANRYKVAKMAQADNEQESIMNEVRQITSIKAAPNLREAARLHKLKRLERERLKQEREKPPGNVVDAILNGTLKKPTVASVKIVAMKKINAVPNVALMEKAKERISLIKQHRSEPVKTIAHTQKGSRVAHIPQVSLPDIPDVLQADKSKLPVNVRTRFLTMLADECFKLYSAKQDAYDRALNEEFSCYEKCKVLTTYRNSAMLAVNRLRKEIQERQSKNLGPLLAGESTQVNKCSDFHGKRFYDNVKKWLLTEEELETHGYPRESGERGKAIVLKEKKEDDFSLNDENQRKCARCSRIYPVDDDGWPLYEDDCMYHPLKKRTIRGQQIFLCCKSTDDTGCVTSDSHVSEAAHSGLLEGYQTTMPAERENDPRSVAVYALDCEMCYTTKGLELTRVTVVDTDCKTVYESLVKPLNPIIDYNTQFSGITKDQMDRTSTNILQVQANILHLCNANTILVGHSLESDMKALKIVHSSVIDTAVLFPHKMGLPHKRALRSLASEYLRKIIQNDVGGHDSAEDAVTCMELIKWKLKEELKMPMKL